MSQCSVSLRETNLKLTHIINTTALGKLVFCLSAPVLFLPCSKSPPDHATRLSGHPVPRKRRLSFLHVGRFDPSHRPRLHFIMCSLFMYLPLFLLIDSCWLHISSCQASEIIGLSQFFFLDTYFFLSFSLRALHKEYEVIRCGPCCLEPGRAICSPDSHTTALV